MTLCRPITLSQVSAGLSDSDLEHLYTHNYSYTQL